MNVSTGFGLVAALLAILGIGEYENYIASATLGGLTVDAFALFTVLAIACAVIFYWAEQNDRGPWGR